MSRQIFSRNLSIMDRRNASRQSVESGFGLIELMISLVIASLLMLGLVTLIGNMQRTYAAQTDQAGVNDKERFAGALFGYSIQTAGYYTVPSPVTFTLPNPIVTWLPAVTTAVGTGSTYAAGQVVAGSTGASATTPDTFTVRFQTGPGDLTDNSNCLGGYSDNLAVGSSVIYESVFSVNTTTNQLQCTVNTTSTVAGVTTKTAGTATTLIDGVSNMKVIYGVDMSGSSTTGSVTQYFSATNMPAANWINVRSMQIALTFAATNNLSTTANGTGAMATATAANQVYSQTFQVMYAVP